MSNSFAGLRNQLEQLTENFETLGVRLAENARGVSEETIPPDATLVEEIAATRKRFSDFREAVMVTAQAAITPEPRLNGNAASLRGLRGLIENLERQEAEMRQLRDRAAALLDDVIHLEYRGQGELPELRDCQQRATALRDRITASSGATVFAPEMLPEITAFANRDTAFADLLDLVEKRGTMDGQTATNLSLKVEEAFGRRIVIEALLGQIVVSGRGDHPAQPSSPQPPEPPPAPPAPSVPSPARSVDTVMPTTRRLEDKAFTSTADIAALIPEPPAPPEPGEAIHVPAIDPVESSRLEIDLTPIPRQTVALHEFTSPRHQRQTEKFADPVSELLTSPETILEPARAEPVSAELVSPEEFEKMGEMAVEAASEIEGEIEAEVEQESSGQDAFGQERVTEELKYKAPVQTPDSARETANAILRFDRSLWPESLRTLLWQMLAEDELPLAYHLTRAMAGAYPDLPLQTPSHLIRALAISRHVRYDNGEIAATLRRDLNRFDAMYFTALEAEPDEDWQQAIHLALAAATLPPALLAPSAEADAVLASIRLNNQLESLAGYCRTVFEFALHKQPLDLRSVAKAPGPQEWQADLSDLLERVKSWVEQAPRVPLKNGMAQRVWLHWIGPQGKIGEMLQALLQNDVRRLAAVRSEIEELSFDKNIEWAVSQTNREIRGWDAPGITAGCIERITRHTREAVEFAQAWVALLQSHPAQQGAETLNRAHDLKETLDQVRDGARADLERFKQSHRNPFLTGAADLCLRTIDAIDRLLSSPTPGATSGARAGNSVSRILNADLLRIPDIAMNERWEPDMAQPDLTPDDQIIRGVVETIAEARSDWARAFELRSQREDHEATRRILEHLAEQQGQSPDPHGLNLDDLAAARRSRLQACRESLLSNAESLRRKIETAMLREWLSEAERADYIAEIELIEQALPATPRFFEQNAKLKSLDLNLETHCARLRAEFETRRKMKIDALRQELDASRVSLTDADYERLLATIESGDERLAAQYLQLALNGDAPPATPATEAETHPLSHHLSAFFPAALNNITALSNSLLLGGSLMEDARNLRREEYLPDPVFRAIKGWETIKHAGRENEEGLREILGFLGFDVREIGPYRTRNSGDWEVLMAIKDGHGRCPVSKFGSDALNRYRLVCLNGKQPPEEIANYLNSTSDNTPAIVFYFGALIEEQRRKLARLCNKNRLIFLALDDLLLLHLCRLPQPLTEAFFRCTLPFSFLNPYNPERPAAAELFFGREDELRQLLDIKGSAFVYGGRRTGKTSLLQEAERRFDKRNFRGDWEQIAIYLDLNAEGVGTAHPLDYLWKKLSDLFIELTGATDAGRQPLGASLFFSLIRKWLDHDPSRKVILLFDDADAFLRLDGAEGFARANRFKALMDEPGYRFRFKAVFAGAQSVLRSSRVENHPLAHFGEPLCLGSLLRTGGDAQAAKRMVETVFGAIGYEFESPDLAVSILSETDYHPHLIQLYCQRLLKYLSGHQAGNQAGNQAGSYTPVFDYEKCPPYVITAKHLQEALQSQELKRRVRESFLATLELDKRYLVIAEAIAYHGELTNEHAFDADWIREQALTWWPEGFRSGDSIFDIRTLLEEMEALGAIRRKAGKYGLRPPVLKSAFGSREELESALLNADKLVPPPNFEAAVSRLPFSSHVSRRSPLTMRQFNELRKRENGVSIVFGCKAADLDSADLFLAHALSQEFTCMNKYASRGDFVRTLADLRQRPAGSAQLLFVPADCLWDEEWMAEAVKHVQKLSGNERFVRVVFAADPAKTWRWLNVTAERNAELNLGQVSMLFSLTPWHDSLLRAWLDDLGIAADDAGRAQITAITGAWPIMLERFYKAVGADLRVWEPELHALRDALPDQREELELAFGLHLSEPSAVLHTLAKRGKASAEDLSVAMRIPVDEIEKSLRWADLLGLIAPTVSKEKAATEWQPTPLVGRLLSL